MDFPSDIPWPDASQSIFTPMTDWENNAEIQSSAGDWYAYITGFKEAAYTLTKHVINTKIHQELLIFPIFFLYRHYIELQIKYIIHEGEKLLDQYPKIQKLHNLKKLWRICTQIIITAFPDTDKKDIDNVSRIIDEIESIDPESITFRYPVDSNNQMTIPIGLRRLNFSNLVYVMTSLETFFDGVSTEISVNLDIKKDMYDTFSL